MRLPPPSLWDVFWNTVAMLAVSSLLWGEPLAADQSPFAGARRLGDAELDRMRGGFVLPNGMDIAIGIQVDTLVNGVLALRTTLTANDVAQIKVFSGGDAAAPESATAGIPVVRLGEVAMDGDGAPGEQQITLVPNGPAAITQWGEVRLQQDERGAVVVLSGNTLELRHMIGTITGSTVANMANDRSIDTMVTVNLDLRDSAIPTGNALVQLESVILSATGRGLY